MVSVTHSSEVRTLRRQVAALQKRVSWIEGALRPKRQGIKTAVPPATLDRQQAENDARIQAMREYWAQDRLDQFRENPRMLQYARENEKRINAFLRERGIRPAKSNLPTAKHLASTEKK